MLVGSAAQAADFQAYAPPPAVAAPAPWFIQDIRVGGFAHGVGTPERGTTDFNFEFVTPPPFKLEDPTWQPLIPRLHAGGQVNLDGRTSYGYFGLTWSYDILPRIYIEGSFGGSVNNGLLGDDFTPFSRAKLGCHLLFRESASIGYRLTEHWSIMATADHISNGGLCTYNRGLNNYGGRLNYTF